MREPEDVEIVLVQAHSPMATSLRKSVGWACIYGDEQSLVFVREEPKFYRVIFRAADGLIAAPEVAPWTYFPAAPLQYT